MIMSEKNILKFNSFLEADRELLRRYQEKKSLPKKVEIKGEIYNIFYEKVLLPCGEEDVTIYFNKWELPY